ncbi:MAG TPA: ABC transporter permease [Thermoanaerobaculia bacterium]|nr:ABC transporter permease [Thermoanaerobaculia bacterium]
MLEDLRLALRNLRRARGFAAIAVLTLAVGIGGATAMFSTLLALVVHPFDFPDSDELVQVWSGDGWPLSPADFLDLHAQWGAFESFGVYQPGSVNVGAEDAQVVSGANCTAGVLPAFGVHPLRGRWLQEGDAAEGAAPVAVIGHGLWQSAFAGDPDIVGRAIRLDGGDVTVVGVMPPEFEFAGPWVRTQTVQVWLPLSLEESKETRDSHWLSGIARLRDDVTVEAADAEIKSIGLRLAELYPDSNLRKKFLVRSLHYEMTRDLGSQVWLLFGSVALVLLVACANVASMMLARSARRQAELGVRVALGATRRALARLALAESLVLALSGAALGVLLAAAGLEVLQQVVPTSEARRAQMAIDRPVLGFFLGAALLTAFVAGLPPILAAMRSAVSTILRDDSRGALGSRSIHRMLRSLVIAQISVAFVLANGAALFSAGYLRLLDENESLATEHVISAQLSLRGDRYAENDQRVAMWKRIVERLEAIPGVSSVGLTSKLPLEGGSNTNALIDDEVYDPTETRMLVERSSVTEGYFETMGLALLRGRNLRSSDDVTEEGVQGVLVNQAMVEKAWPDQDPIGEVIRGNNPGDPWYTATVVGVVESVRQWGAAAEVQPEMFTTPPGHWGNQVYVNVRSPQPAAALTPLVRAEIAALDPELALQDVRTLEQVVLDATASQRGVAGLVDFFMAVALGLVAVGLYGTLSFHVARRTRETGLRLAVGALRADIVRLVLAQGLRWVAVGIAIGLAGVLALARLVENLVYGMDGLTATPLALATGAVASAAIVACWLPARRASRLDPIQALRND